MPNIDRQTAYFCAPHFIDFEGVLIALVPPLLSVAEIPYLMPNRMGDHPLFTGKIRYG